MPAPTRPATPVPDLCTFLSGTWRLVRLAFDGTPPRAMRLYGTATFTASDGGLLCEERGTMTAAAYRGEAFRRTFYRIDAASAATAFFEDGRPFHALDLGAGRALVRHDCPPDLYEGRYRVLSPACWLLTWRVTGPRKHQVIASRFSRALP